MNFVCTAFEIGDKMLTLSSMENLIVQCNRYIRCMRSHSNGAFSSLFSSCSAPGSRYLRYMRSHSNGAFSSTFSKTS